MPFQILKTDILSLRCDAIINPTDESFSGSGGLDLQIHRAAGPALRQACDRLGTLGIGEAVLTPSFLDSCRAIIHTVSPWWTERETDLQSLRACYRNSLQLATDYQFERVAFPLIGSGTRGFPKETVLSVAAEEISDYLNRHDDVEILLVIRDRSEFQPDPALLAELDRYILFVGYREQKQEQPEQSFQERKSRIEERRRIAKRPPRSQRREWEALHVASTESFPAMTQEDGEAEAEETAMSALMEPTPAPAAAAPVFEQSTAGHFEPDRAPVLDESFSQMVLRKIDEKGFRKDADCYRRANIDRRLFSRIRSDRNYHPKKTTAVALAVALELPPEEAKELLMKAGYSLSHSILFDVIIEYCLVNRKYNIFQINELLCEYDQPLLGG